MLCWQRATWACLGHFCIKKDLCQQAKVLQDISKCQQSRWIMYPRIDDFVLGFPKSYSPLIKGLDLLSCIYCIISLEFIQGNI